jgi:SAM-dependent methyltransferase
MNPFFPVVYDMVMYPLEKIWVGQVRRILLNEVRGVTLEIGSGSGANFPFYGSVERLIALEHDAGMIARSKLLAQKKYPFPLIIQADAQSLPFASCTFDTVIATLVFCTIPDPVLALCEARRVLKPDGQILLFEHVRLEGGISSRIQDGLTPVWKHLAGGCHLNRDTLSMIRQAGFQVQSVSAFWGGLFVLVKAKN